jgi:hypothetical protein
LAIDFVSIAPLPGDYFEFVDDPEGPSFDKRQRGCFPEHIREWIEAEQFVLELGEHYRTDNNGEATAT